MKKTALVILKDQLTEGEKQKIRSQPSVGTIIAYSKLKADIGQCGHSWVDLETLIEAGSIYEASAFAEELSRVTLPDGTVVSKSFVYEGYELWWMHYNHLYLYVCLPYTQLKGLLRFLEGFDKIFMYEPPFRGLFSTYFQGHGIEMSIITSPKLMSPGTIPFGVFIQILLTLISVPVLMFRRKQVMVFTGDKFDSTGNYDFRLRFIYEELWKRKIAFVETIRSLESWRTVLNHAYKRRRPVIYSEAVAYLGRFLSFLTGGRIYGRRKYNPNLFMASQSPQQRFELLITTRYLIRVYDDVWAIRIMTALLRSVGVKAAYITAVLERNFHAFVGCKRNGIPTIGILHGVASRHYNVYDFTPAFSGTKRISVDKYGLWSDWWKEYYSTYSKAYSKEQLFVSGPMRPRTKEGEHNKVSDSKDSIRVLFVSEQLAVPKETLPYLKALLLMKGVSLHFKFRPYRDGFEQWLREHHPEILDEVSEDKILRGTMQEAISTCDVVVGSHSTAALEALLVNKPVIFFATSKWGDYFDLDRYNSSNTFYVHAPEQLEDAVRASARVPREVLTQLQERFFGDPRKNGSSWVVDQLEMIVKGGISQI